MAIAARSSSLLKAFSRVDLEQGALTFYRAKIGKTQTHKLNYDTLCSPRRA